jgi:hypothetical protein
MNSSSRNRRSSCADDEVCSIRPMKHRNKLLQRPASLEITPLPVKWIPAKKHLSGYATYRELRGVVGRHELLD